MTFPALPIQGHLYFVTGSIVNWAPLFKSPDYASIPMKALDWHRKTQRLHLFAFCVMPNHIHWISCPIPPHSIQSNLQSFASYTAHQLLKLARMNKDLQWLDVFSEAADKDKRHKIWQRFQAKNIFSEKFLHQKLEYLHNNPLQPHHNLASDRAAYHLSSACYYDRGEKPIIEIDDLNEYLSGR
jgi:REP element-mobilizing transposase RayT